MLRTFPEIVDPRTFTIGFPVASFSVRVPESATGYTLEFGPTASPARVLALKGTDRNGDPVNIVATTASWSQPTLQITVDRDTTLANGAATADIASALEALLDTVPGHPFAPPEVRWLDDGEEWGLLHVGLFYAPAAGGEEPSVTAFDADSVFLEFSPGADASLAASFSLPGTEDALADYLGRILADATVDEFAQSNIQQSHFDYRIRPPEVTIDGSDLSVRINLAPEHGRTVDAENPARIERVAQTGLVKIGMDTPTVKNGGTTKLSGSGDPTLEHGEELFSDVFTAMVDASIAYQDGPEEDRIDRLNSFFNCEDLSAIECTFNFIHNFVVVPVNRCPAGNPNGADREPAVEGLRGNTSGDKMVDSGSRAKPVTTIAGNRRKIFASLRLPTASSPERHLRDAGTLAHELGHGILGYRDQYSADVDRRDLRYCGDYDLMANSAARVHMSSYHKRISGWLDDDAIMVLDRPEDGSPIDREIVLVQLEAWDPTLGAEAYSVLAHSLMPGTPYGAPAVTAAFLRLGGDAHSYDILELRGPGERFSKNIPTPRVIAINAVDPRDQTRYGEVAEDAEIAEDALLRYRRQIHLLDDSLSTAGDTVDLGDLPKLAEAGLRISLQELTSASTGPFTFHLARVRIQWERGRAIDLAFRKSLPDWQSPDIAIIKPEDIPEDGTPEFPQHQPPDILETFRVPASGEGDLQHKILARVWNQGDADAFNVQVELVEKLPGGGGDWRSESVIGSQLIDGTIGSGDNGIVSFNWNVSSGLDTHVCFRAQVGDRDPEPGASDDTTIENNWAQQNVFVYEASADSPPRPVDFTYSVTNNGPYTEEVRLFPKGMGVGSRLTITPRKMYIRAYSRGVFRVAPSSTNACLPPAAARTSPFCSRRCASTITFTNRGAPPSTRSSPASRRPPHSKAM